MNPYLMSDKKHIIYSHVASALISEGVLFSMVIDYDRAINKDVEMYYMEIPIGKKIAKLWLNESDGNIVVATPYDGNKSFTSIEDAITLILNEIELG